MRTKKLASCAHSICLAVMLARVAACALLVGMHVPSIAAQPASSAIAVDVVGVKQASPPIALNGLSVQYLHETGEVGQPRIVVGWYDMTNGLFAGYQATSGKRILFRSRWKGEQASVVEVVHFDNVTGRVERVIGTRAEIAIDSGEPRRYLEVMGADVLKEAKREGSKEQWNVLTTFMQADVGQALSEGVPALYAVLEDLERDSRLAQLQAPFGALLAMLQIHSGVHDSHDGFAHAEAIVGGDKAARMRDACRGKDCILRGRHFMINQFGLFDTMSKPRTAPMPRSLVQYPRQVSEGIGRAFIAPSLMSSKLVDDNECGRDFGYCGPGEFHPGDVKTPACERHDRCVCNFGHLECIYFPPDLPPGGCITCGDLFDAIESYLRALFGNSPPSPDEIEDEDNWWGDSPG